MTESIFCFIPRSHGTFCFDGEEFNDVFDLQLVV